MREHTTDTIIVCFVLFHAYTYFDPETDAPPDGAERQPYLVGQRPQSDFDVHFVVGDFGQPETECRDGVTLHRAFEPSSDAAASRRLHQLWPLVRAMRWVDADVYVFRGDFLKATATFAFTKLLGRRWVYNLANDAHAKLGDSLTSDLTDVLFQPVIANADHVIQSTYQHSRLQEACGIESAVVPNGYPPIDETGPETKREFFLYVGRISEVLKRTHLFLKRAKRLTERSFVLIGPPEYDVGYTECIANEAAALDNVRYLGTVDPDEIHKYYKRAIALVNTSPQERFPNTFFEAWRSETPIVSLDVDPGRLLEDEGVGYADGDFDAFATIAERIAEDPAFVRRAGRTRLKVLRTKLPYRRDREAVRRRAPIGRRSSRTERRPPIGNNRTDYETVTGNEQNCSRSVGGRSPRPNLEVART